MKYNDEDIKKMNQTFRESLKPNWLELDFSQTDKGKGLPKPNVCKTYKNGEIFDLNVDVQDISAKTLYVIPYSNLFINVKMVDSFYYLLCYRKTLKLFRIL